MRKLLWTSDNGVAVAVDCSYLGSLDSFWPFEEVVARLLTLSGQTHAFDPHDTDGKVSVAFFGTFGGEAFELYDYRADDVLHIGGAESLDVRTLCEVLLTELREVRPTPFEAARADGSVFGFVRPYGH